MHSGKKRIKERLWMSQVYVFFIVIAISFIALPIGAGNAFLGGLSAGLLLAGDNMHEGKVSREPLLQDLTLF